jgi:hypothetical protein
LLLGGLSRVETPQVGQGKAANELGTGLAGEATGAGTLLALADTASSSSFVSGCCIRFRLLEFGCFVQSLSREAHPTVKRCRPFLAAGARLNAHHVGDSFYDIAKTYLFLFDKAGESNTMRLPFSFICFFLLFGAHRFVNSALFTVYPLLFFNR